MRYVAGLFLAASLVTVASAPARADCTVIDQGIRTALAEQDVKVYDALFQTMVAEPACDAAYRDQMGRVMARSALANVPIDAAPGAIDEVMRFGRPWQVLVALGDAHFDLEQWARAVSAYEEALDDMRNVQVNPKPPPEEIERRTYKRAIEARALAPTFLAARRNRSGEPTGLASPKFRNFTAVAVPVPVRFEFDSDALTDQGVAAVKDIFAYLQDDYADYVAIIGHTDPKGSEPYNLDLSLRRANSVASFLRSLGYAGDIRTIGRGESERFIPDDVSKYEEEQLHAFDRRVEYSVTPVQ